MSSVTSRLDRLQKRINELRGKAEKAEEELEGLEEKREELAETQEKTIQAKEALRKRIRETRGTTERLERQIREEKQRQRAFERRKREPYDPSKIDKPESPQEQRVEEQGIPGPGRGPAPDSLGEKMAIGVKRGLEETYRLTMMARPPPSIARGPKPGSLGEQVQTGLEKAFQQQEQFFTTTRTRMEKTIGRMRYEAEQAMEKDERLRAKAFMAAALGTKFAKGFVKTTTYPFRPLKWRETISSIIALTKMQRRQEAIHYAAVRFAGDPLGMTAEALGMYTGAKVVSSFRWKGRKTASEKLGEEFAVTDRELGRTNIASWSEAETAIQQDVKGLQDAPGASPASIMPRGTWRSTWEITRKSRGSAQLLLTKQTIELIQKTRTYPLSSLAGLVSAVDLKMGLATYVDPVQRISEKALIQPITETMQTARQLQGLRVTTRQKQRPLQYPLVKPSPPSQLQDPWQYPLTIQDTTQDVLTTPKVTLKQVPQQVQKQTIKTVPQLIGVTKMTFPEMKSPLYFEEPKKKKKRKKKRRKVGELRLRPVKLKDVLKI